MSPHYPYGAQCALNTVAPIDLRVSLVFFVYCALCMCMHLIISPTGLGFTQTHPYICTHSSFAHTGLLTVFIPPSPVWLPGHWGGAL